MRRDIDRQEVVRLYTVERLSTPEIERKLGLSKGAVRSLLVARGIRLRSIRASLRVKWPKGRTGPAAANWSGGRITSGNGYVGVYAPSHPRASRQGYVMEHRLVMEKVLGRRLKRAEIVHHLNGVKTDNRPENLGLKRSIGHHVSDHFKAGHKVHALEARIEQLEAFIRTHGLAPPA